MIPSWLRLLANNLFPVRSRRRSAAGRRRRSACLEVEPLEQRCLPAIVTWTGALMADPDTSKSGQDLDGDNRWSAQGTRNGVVVTNWDNPFIVGRANDFPHNGDTIVFPAGAVKVGQALAKDANGKQFVSDNLVNGQGPRNDLFDIGRSDNTLNVVTISDSGYTIFNDPNSLGPNGSIRLDGNFTADMASGISTWAIGITIPPAPGGNTPIKLFNVVHDSATLGIRQIDLFDLFDPNNPIRLTNGGNGRITEEVANAIVRKVGPGTLNLGGNNSYTGVTQVEAGTLLVTHPNALGIATGSQGTEVQDGATLAVGGNSDPLSPPATITVNANESLAITGDGVLGLGALTGTGTWAGPVSVVNNASIGATTTLAVSGLAIGDSLDLDPDPPTIDGLALINPNLTISGLIGSTGSGTTLSKVDGGLLRLVNNDNNYQLDTVIKSGTLRVIASAPNALAPGYTTTVQAAGRLELFGDFTLDSEDLITINGTGLGTGALSTIGKFTHVVIASPVLLGSSSFVGGTFDYETRPTLSIATLTINDLSSPAGLTLTKVDENTVILPFANPNFLAGTNINLGTVIVRDGLALGPPSPDGGPVVVNYGTNNGGTLQLEGIYTINKDLTLNGFGFNLVGALHTVGGSSTDVTFAGPITIGSSTLIDTDPLTNLTVTGVIDGASNASLTKNGKGTLQLKGDNTYLGETTIAEGTAIIQAASGLGGKGGAGTTVQNGATLQIQGGIKIPDEALTLSGLGFNGNGVLHAVSGNNTISGPVTLLRGIGAAQARIQVDAGSSLNFNQVVSGAADLIKTGGGTLLLTGSRSNTATGLVFVNAGTLALGKSAGLKAVGGNITVGDDAGGDSVDVLRLDNSNQIPDTLTILVNSSGLFNLNNFNETIGPLTLKAGEVASGSGTLTLSTNVVTQTFPGDASLISGNLSLGASTRTFTVARDTANINDLTINAVISGVGSAGLTKAGAGRLTLGGANTYSGPTTVSAGTVRLGADNVLPDASAVSLASSTVLEVNGKTDTLGSLTGSGAVQLGGGFLGVGAANTSTTYSGAISGSGELIKVGTGTFTLTGNSPNYTGTSRVSNGTLLVNANQSAAAVLVEAGGTLGGTGTVGAITTTGGAVAPGQGPGILNAAGDVTFDSNGSLVLDIKGTTPGSKYDQLKVTGAVDLGNVNPVINPISGVTVGDTFTIITATGGVSGTFMNVPDGGSFNANGYVFQVDYHANDVMLTITEVVVTTTLTSSLNPSNLGDSVTFTVSISSPVLGTATGKVEFFDGTTSLGVKTLDTSGTASVTTATLPGGTRAIRVDYAGDGTFPPGSTSLDPAQVVNRADSTTVLTADPSSPTFGDTVTFTATVSKSSTPTFPTLPTGLVTFIDTFNGTDTQLGSVQLDSNGKATLDISTLQGGDHVIRADYAGDGNYLASSGTVSLTVSPADTTTDLDIQPSTTVYGQQTTLSATVNSTATPSGMVTFVDTTTGSTLGTVSLDNTGQASLNVNGLDLGTHDIRADFLANSNFNASSSALVTLTVNPADTTTTVKSSENPSVVGDSVTFTATVTPESASTLRPVAGSVSFVDTTTGTSLGSGTLDANSQFSITTSDLAVGTHTIEATFTDSSGRYLTSSGTVDQEVDPISTTTTLSTSGSPTTFGDSVTFTALVSAAPNSAIPTGSVVFNVDGSNVATQSVDGTGHARFTTALLPAGKHTIFAQYVSNTVNFSNSTSGNLKQDVNPRNTRTTLSSSDNPSFPGEAVTFTAIVSAQGSSVVPTGSVTFKIDGGSDTVVSLNSMGRATFTTSTLGLGIHTITADYKNSDGNFVDSSATPLKQTVASVATTTTLTSSDINSFPTEPVTFTAIVSAPKGGTPTGSVTFKVDGGGDTVVSLDKGRAAFTTSTLSLGQHTITADYTSDSIVFTNSSATPLKQTVASVATTTTLTSSPRSASPGQSVTFTATVSAPRGGTPTGSVTFKVDGGGDTVVSLNGSGQATLTTSTLSLGRHTITADYTSDTTVFTNSSATPLTLKVSEVVTITATDPNASEVGLDPGQFVVSRSGSTSTSLTVHYTVGGTATPGGDYVALSGHVVIPAGASSATINVVPIDDPFLEPTETIVVTLAASDTTTIGSPASAVVNLVSDDVKHRYVVSGTDAGVPAEVRVFDYATGSYRFDFLPFGLFTGGVRVATGDFNGDSVPDIIVATASATSYVAVFDGTDGHPLAAFFAFGGASNGAYVAAGNILGGSQAAILVGAGAGTPGSPVEIYTGGSAILLGALLPFGPGYAGGTTVGTGDITGDGIADFITGTATGATQVDVFSGGTGIPLASFLAFGGNAQGVNVALADLDFDGHADVLVGAGPGGPAQVMAYDLIHGGVAFASFVLSDPQAPPSLTGVSGQNGVNVGAVDVNGDGTAEILATLGPGSLPRLFAVRALPLALVDAFFLYDPRFVGGTFIAGSSS